MQAYIFISLMQKVKEQVQILLSTTSRLATQTCSLIHRHLFIYLFIFIVTKVQVNNAVIMK